MSSRRLFFRISLCLVLGAVTTVGVAWGRAAQTQLSDWTFYTPYSTEDVLAESDFGWPVAAMTNDPDPRIGVPRRYSLKVGDAQLPILPIWPGFVIDGAIYAALWLGLFSTFGPLKRWARKRCGLCPMCKYNVRGNPEGVTGCAECGWGREEIEVTD